MFGMYISRYNSKGQEVKLEDSLENVKAIARADFEAPEVRSVCVFDENGVARLYLKHEADGSVRTEER